MRTRIPRHISEVTLMLKLLLQALPSLQGLSEKPDLLNLEKADLGERTAMRCIQVRLQISSCLSSLSQHSQLSGGQGRERGVPESGA